jgi:hypothetical protein
MLIKMEREKEIEFIMKILLKMKSPGLEYLTEDFYQAFKKEFCTNSKRGAPLNSLHENNGTHKHRCTNSQQDIGKLT